MNFLGLSITGWLLWLAVLIGIIVRCLNMWAYGANATLARFRHDRRLFRTLMPISGLMIGVLAWSWGTYGSAVANLALAAAALRPDVLRRQRWLAKALGRPTVMATTFIGVPAAILVLTDGSWAHRAQLAGGYQLIVGFFAMLAGAWAGERSADTWSWLIICLSFDLMLGASAVALAAAPIIALEAMALGLDVTKLTRKSIDRVRSDDVDAAGADQSAVPLDAMSRLRRPDSPSSPSQSSPSRDEAAAVPARYRVVST